MSPKPEMSVRPERLEGRTDVIAELEAVQADIRRLRPRGFGPPIHGPAIDTRIFLVGQAPGPHEARFGR
ncbi:MAG TPA: uracil-DNA glycosylase, partial [Anaeromyxobacteraceae bacterium]|nr:uracil-DNA glycosylase [Anaeromyxobacteraceae bacterium]